MTRKKEILILLLLFITALSIRIVYLSQTASSPLFKNPVMDEKYHVELVEQIKTDNEPKEPYFRAPLYPYFLTMLSKATNGSFFSMRLIQIILGSMLPILLYLLGLRLFRRKVALIAAFLAAIYPTFIYYDAALLITFLITLFSVTLLWALYRYKPNSFMSPLIIGVLLGAAGLARPNILLFGPFLFIWVIIILKKQIGIKKALAHYVVIGISAFIVILPVTLRNYKVSGDPVFIAWQGGINFYIGNNHLASGWSATLPGIDKSWEGGYTESIAQAEKAKGRILQRSEVSDYWFDQTFKDIAEHPAKFANLIIKKIRLLLNGYETPNNQDIYLSKEFSSLFNILLFQGIIYFPFGLLLPLALVGIYFSFSQWKKFLPIYLFLLAYSSSLILFFVCARFRQPMIPFLLLFAVYAVFKTKELYLEKNYKLLIIGGCLFIALMFESNHDILKLNQQRVKAENYHLIGNAYLEQNNLRLAEQEFIKSVKIDPTFARGFNNLGLIQGRKGNHVQAQMNFKRAIELDPNVVESYVNYATTEIVQSNFDEAISILLDAQKQFPLDDNVVLKLGMTYFQNGNIQKANLAVKRALQLNPQNKLAQSILQQINQPQP